MRTLIARIVGMIKILEARAMRGHRLWLRFDDGVEGEVDLSHLVGEGVFKAWEDPEVFARVSVEGGRSVAWDGDIDLCADSLYLEVTGKTPGELFEKPRGAEVDA
jgi:hypothetical protein